MEQNENIKSDLFNNKAMYPMIDKVFSEYLSPNVDYASFLRENYELLENLTPKTYPIQGGNYYPNIYNNKQSKLLEVIFKSPLSAISKKFTDYSGILKNVNSINILKRNEQVVYLIGMVSQILDVETVQYFGHHNGMWTYAEMPGYFSEYSDTSSEDRRGHEEEEERKITVDVNETFGNMCSIYGIDKCEEIEENYKNNIDFFLSRGIKELYVLCNDSLLYRDRLIIDKFKLVQYNTSTLPYHHEEYIRNIDPYAQIKNKPKNIITYFDYINGGRKPPMIETIDGPVSYYYLENDTTGVKMLLLGDLHVRNKTETCNTNEQIYSLVDYLRIILDYATKVQNIVIDVFLESDFGGGLPIPFTRDFTDGGPYIYNVNSLFLTCSNAKNCKLQHRIHSVNIRPRLDVILNSEGFVQNFLTSVVELTRVPTIEASKLYDLIVRYFRAYPYLTNLVDELINVERFQKQYDNIRDRRIVDKLLLILKSKYETINLSWKEIMMVLCNDCINGNRSRKRVKLFKFFAEYQNSYFYARLLRDYNDTKGLYSEKPCNIIHYAGAAHIESIKNDLVNHMGYKILNSQDKNLLQCISLKEMKQPLFYNSVCKNINNLPVQEKNRSDISRRENFYDVQNAKKRSEIRYDDMTLKFIDKLDATKYEKYNIMYCAGFDEPFLYDFKYIDRVLKEVPNQYKYIRTLFRVYGIESTAYDINIFKPLAFKSDYKEIIMDFMRDPEVYIYPSMDVAFDDVKKGFMIKRKAIRRDTNIFSLRALALKWKIPKVKSLSLKQLKNLLLDKSDKLYKKNYTFVEEEDKEYYKMIKTGSSLYLKTLAKALNVEINDIKNIEDIRSQVLETITYMLVKPAKSRIH